MFSHPCACLRMCISLFLSYTCWHATTLLIQMAINLPVPSWNHFKVSARWSRFLCVRYARVLNSNIPHDFVCCPKNVFLTYLLIYVPDLPSSFNNYLDDNSITGTFPNFFFSLPKLTALILGNTYGIFFRLPFFSLLGHL